jgi:hypothetical protein
LNIISIPKLVVCTQQSNSDSYTMITSHTFSKPYDET